MNDSTSSADSSVPQARGGGGGGCLKVAGIGCAIIAVLILGAGVYIAANWDEIKNVFKGAAVSAAKQVLLKAVDDSELSDDQKTRIRAEVEKLADAYASGEISDETMIAILEKLQPVLQFAIGQAVVSGYIEPSGLSEAEKSQGSLTVRRLLHGSFAETIDQDRLKTVMEPVTDSQGQLRHPISDADLREFLVRAKAAADEAQVPLDLPEPDIAGEIARAIEEAASQEASKP